MNALRRSRAQDHGTRRAVTLIEIILVLAILVLVAAAAWPSIDRSLADQRLRDAADVVRAKWQHARAKAMSSGVAYQFCYSPDERTFWIEPCEDTTAADVTANPSGTTSEADRSELPEQVTFVEGKVAGSSTETLPTDTSTTMEQSQPLEPETTEQNAPVIFSPDGTCSTAELTLRNDHDRVITVSIHGLTAIAVVGEVFNSEEGP